MRAGLLSKAVDHITLLMDDWFMGARPRTIVVPCPHCSHGVTPPVKMERSYSEVLDLLPSAEREELSVEGLEDDSCNNPFFGTMGLLNNELEGQTEVRCQGVNDDKIGNIGVNFFGIVLKINVWAVY